MSQSFANQAVTVPLSTPIKAHGETLSALTLRPPTGKDLRASGYPMVFGRREETSINTEAVSRLIGALAEIPPSSVDMLSMPDWSACMGAVLSFTQGGTPKPSSNDTGTSPIGGATPTSSSD